ncbi:MAG: hypothetical protein HOI23_16600 [Deltaproteobacteria bacterium]|nr:hypothetical protein [Deltaproteobacteria bacterium]
MRRFLGNLALMASLVAGLAACSAGIGDVDLTQPDKLSKSLFEGEWYYRPIVSEVQYDDYGVFEGYEGDMSRVKWRIDERLLTAYRSHELVDGMEMEEGDTEFLGNPVAQFRIESHFDIMRSYNPNTGDQSNKIIEDTKTRPWYEREHMRVNWSVNLLMDPSSLEGMVTYWSQGAYYKQENEVDDYHRVDINEERHPDTNEVLAASINVTGHYWTQVDPRYCSYYMNGMECGASESKMKMSFMRIVGKRDYEKLHYPDYLPIYQEDGDELIECSIVDETNCDRKQEPMFARFGYFRTERQAYDDEYQITRHNRIFLINRWNLWERNYRPDGSLIPMKERNAGKITYYTNPDIPTDQVITDATNLMAEDWDKLFRKTVASRQSLNGTPVNWETDLEPIFEILQNTCNLENATNYATTHKLEGVLAKYGIGTIAQGNLKRACAVLEYASGCDHPENDMENCRPDQYDITPRFEWQKHGDVRYSFAHWVDTPMGGPLGYGPSAADPLTGEIISANANIYGASIDTLSAYAADLVTMMNGDTTVADLINGTHIRQAMGQDSQQMQNQMGRDMFSLEKMKQMNQDVHNHNELQPIMSDKQPEMRARMALEHVIGHDAIHPEMASQARESSRAKLSRVQGSYIDTELLTNDELRRGVIGATHYQPNQGMIGGEHEDFTALEWVLDGEEFLAGKRALDKELASKNIMMAEWADDGMASVAAELQGKTWDEVYDFMRGNIYRAVQLHELGHTVGLRHNFGGSMDPLNFHHGFWDDYNPTTRKVERVDENGNPTMAERLMYSTIMDYDARFYADSFAGLGPYDNAAIHFGYGQMVEVFDHDQETPGTQSDLALGFQNLFFFHDYENIPLWFDGSLTCDNSLSCHPDYLEANGYYQDYNSNYNASQDTDLDQDVRDLADYNADLNYSQYDRYLNSYWKNAVDGRTPQAEKISQRAMIPFENVYAEWTDYWRDVDFAIPFDEVPYEFCPDEYSWASNISCQTWDKGANYTEIIQDRALRHNAYYYISNYKRDKLRFGTSTRSYLNRLQGRYFGPMSTVYRYYLYGTQGIGFDKNGDYLTYTDFPFGRDWQSAAMEGLNYLNSVINQPEAGMHCLVGDTYKHWDDGEGNLLPDCVSGETMDIPLGVGKPLRTTWTDEYMYKPTSIGFYWDKLVAMLAMTSNEGSFVRDLSDYLDSGTFSLSYWRTLQPQMMDVFGSAFGTGESPYGWHVDANTNMFASKPVVDVYDPATMPNYDNMAKVESPWTWSLRYWAVVLPFTRFNSMFDYTADFSQYAKVCLDGYMDCMTFTDENGVSQVETYIDPITNYTYIAPGDLAGATSVLLNLESQLVSDPGNEELKAQLADAETGTKMMLGARMLQEAQDYATDVYAPALAAWTLANDAHDLDPSEANYTALLDATYALDVAERGVNENTSFLDIVRDLGRMTEYGGGW